MDETWVPDSCTLPTVDRPLRIEEFDQLFASHLTAVERRGPARARLTLVGDGPLVEWVRDLTARESECCSFFEFSAHASPEGARTQVVLDIGVPGAQAEVLEALLHRAESVRARAS